jgi:small subunit ribosomal protein S8
MAQDIVSDGLNQIMNAKNVEKTEVLIKRSSKVLVSLLDLMKKDGLVDYEILGDDKKPVLKVFIKRLNICKAIKPRYMIGVADLEKYLRRFLPSRKIGKLIVSTTKGLKDQHDCKENNLGGSLIAYYY